MAEDRSTEGCTAGPIAKLVRVKDDDTEVVYTAMNWRLPLDGKQKDISNFRDGRRKANTLTDATFSADVVWDPDDPPTTEANMGLRLGMNLKVRCYTDETHFFEVFVKVATISPALANIDGDVVMMPFTAGLNNNEIVYPLDPT